MATYIKFLNKNPVNRHLAALNLVSTASLGDRIRSLQGFEEGPPTLPAYKTTGVSTGPLYKNHPIKLLGNLGS